MWLMVIFQAGWRTLSLRVGASGINARLGRPNRGLTSIAETLLGVWSFRDINISDPSTVCIRETVPVAQTPSL